MDEKFDIVVVGSCMIDYISYVPRLPRNGETLRASKFETNFGGKGANQCVSAARLGSKTLLLARLGSDSWGKDYMNHLEKENININHVQEVTGEKTGIAQINVAENGDNQIVIITGANKFFCTTNVEENIGIIPAKVLICQLEIPLQATLTALRNFNGTSILNAAPALTETSLELLTLSDILCVNEFEAASMTKCSVSNILEAKCAVMNFLTLGCRTVIITLGEEGAIYGTNKDSTAFHVRIPKLRNVVDTTGAGDSFIGSLAHFIANYPDLSLKQKIYAACRVASLSVQKYGTQSSFPYIKDLDFDIRNMTVDCVSV